MSATLTISEFDFPLAGGDVAEGANVRKPCGCHVLMSLPGPSVCYVRTLCAKADRLADFAQAGHANPALSYDQRNRRWDVYSAHVRPTWAD
jgi:hypothetical protein